MSTLDPTKIKRIAINTGGGDAPGLNAVIRAVTLSALDRGWDVVGIRHGYRGLIDTKELVTLDRAAVRGITHLGGSILGMASRDSPFEYPVKTAEGTKVTDISDRVVENFRAQKLDALVCVGGDGSMRLARKFIAKGMPIVGVPKTIDNDLAGTATTFGYDTAVTTATDAIDKLHSTAESHERVMVVEVMGRYAGWIALASGMAGSADVILIPEIPYDMEKVCEKIRRRERQGLHFSIVVAAEGAKARGGELMVRGPKEAGREVQLGGVGQSVAEEITRMTGKETRSLVLGHLQRGGTPTPFDRLIGLRFGAAAVRTLGEGKADVLVVLDPPGVNTIPLTSDTDRMRPVPLDCDSILTARQLGINLGD